MRPLAILLAALVMALSPPAVLAKSDKTPPGQAAQEDKPEPPGQGKKPDKPEPPGRSTEGPNPPGSERGTPPGQLERGGSSDQDEAQRAVEEHEALPLAKIVAVAETRSSGHVINARLVRVETVLLYQLTMLDDAGRSWREYYHARTGNPVVIP